MNEYEEKLKAYIRRHNIGGEHLSFKQSCHTVKEAARAADADIEDFVKNICMIDAQGSFIVAIVKGEDRASTSRVGKALGIDRPRIAEPEEILEKTGYPCGGVPPGWTVITYEEKLVKLEDYLEEQGYSTTVLEVEMIEEAYAEFPV